METNETQLRLFEKFASSHLRLTPEQLRGAQMYHHFVQMMKAQDPENPGRWESAVRKLYYGLGFNPRASWEIEQVTNAVRELAGDKWTE